MEDVKNLLTVTLVVMAAGTSIYTIKTCMKPGMDLNINLEDAASYRHHELTTGGGDGGEKGLNESSTTTTTPLITASESTTQPNRTINTAITNLPTTGIPVPEIGNNATAVHKAANKSSSSGTISSGRKRSLPLKELKSTHRPGDSVAKSNEHRDDDTDGTNGTVVSTSLGKLEGLSMNVFGKNILAFLGVNYAKAPVDKLRFRKPVPVDRWNGTLNAKKFGYSCIQVDNQTGVLSGRNSFNEDCLNLNIWTPSTSHRSKLPVLFFIHGGSFTHGSNSADETDGRILASLQNLVVVSVNYRLGPFGFLNLPAKDSSTNLGMHDVLEALRWTRNNVHHFGGDPNAITVAGHSSGAIVAALLLTSPITSDENSLFKRVILQSGASTVFNFYYEQSHKSSEEFVTLLGCRHKTSTLDQVWRCVQNVSSDELVRAAQRQLSREQYAYSPKIGDTLVPGSPRDLLDQLRTLNREPRDLLIGTNNCNQAPFFANMGYPQLFTKKSPTLKDLEEVRQFLSSSLKDWGISRRTLRLINSFFLEKSNTLEPKAVLRAMHDIFGDLSFTCPTLYFAERFANKQQHRSAYYYYYDNSQHWAKTNKTLSAGDELPFVFGYPLRFPQRFSGQDIDFSKRIMNIWATFVRTGKPANINGAVWPSYSGEQPSYVELSSKESSIVHHHKPTATSTNSSTVLGSSGPHYRFNCDTWKHAYKIFT